MPAGSQPPRWIAPVLGLVAVFLVPWTLWLTFTLPSRHVTDRYDLAWVGFDIALAVALSATALAALGHGARWLVPLAAVSGTMLVCDAWFDVVTAHTGGEMAEAVLEAAFAEIPLAALCAYIVIDVERFQRTFDRLRPPTPAARRAAARAMTSDALVEPLEARARRDRPV